MTKLWNENMSVDLDELEFKLQFRVFTAKQRYVDIS